MTITSRLVRWAIGTSVLAAVMFGAAGGWRDPWLWAFMATWSILMLYGMLSITPELARERFTPPEPGADRVPLAAIRVAAVAHLLLGAADAGRWHLFPVPPTLRLAGLAGVAVFGALVFRSMLSNRFFSPVVRIQSDRGHHLIDQGPYALVRHPGYAGMILSVPCSGLALGSWLSVAVALAFAALILRRVAFEDAFLRANLDGYQAYRTRVPYRLLPGIW